MGVGEAGVPLIHHKLFKSDAENSDLNEKSRQHLQPDHKNRKYERNVQKI